MKVSQWKLSQIVYQRFRQALHAIAVEAQEGLGNVKIHLARGSLSIAGFQVAAVKIPSNAAR